MQTDAASAAEYEKARQMLSAARSEMNADRAAFAYDLGFIDRGKLHDSFSRLTTFMSLFRIRESGSYKQSGMSWSEFCLAAGLPVRTVNENLKKLRPAFEAFQADFAEIFRLPFNKIKYLGDAIQAESARIDQGILVIGNTRIAMKPENLPEIEAAIEDLKTEAEREKQEIKKELDKEKRQRDQIVKESIRGLETEKEALVKELHSVKDRIPDDTERKNWKEKAVQELQQKTTDFVAFLSRLTELLEKQSPDNVFLSRLWGELSVVDSGFDEMRAALDKLQPKEEWEEMNAA
jgi:hypothetical protein